MDPTPDLAPADAPFNIYTPEPIGPAMQLPITPHIIIEPDAPLDAVVAGVAG